MRTLDLFCGAGGLSLGLEAAGLTPVGAVELDTDCCATYSRMFPSVNLIPDSVSNIDFQLFAGRVEVVAGGPPCQPFSTGGKRLGPEDGRDFIPEFVRAVRQVGPVLFVMENVPGLDVGRRRSYLHQLLDGLKDSGYHVSSAVLNAADYGVPQKRRRLFVVGSRVARFQFPAPTHGPKGALPYEPARSVLHPDQLVGAPNPAKVVYAKNPDLRPSPYDGHLFNGGGRPIDLDRPCSTILASAGGNKTHFIDTLGEVPGYHAELMAGHPPRVGTLEGGRRLTVEESAMIQAFPRSARFCGSRSSQYAQVGNAVPPLLAAQLGFALIRHLDGLVNQVPAA